MSRILTLCSASRAQTAAMMPTLSCPTTVTMAFIAKFLLMAARRQARRGGILLYTASVLYHRWAGK